MPTSASLSVNFADGATDILSLVRGLPYNISNLPRKAGKKKSLI